MEPNETAVTVRQCDDKGRPNVSEMTSDELMREAVATLRSVQDLAEKFIADFAKNPAFGMLGKMFGGR